MPGEPIINRNMAKAAKLNLHKKAFEAIISVKATSRSNIGVITQLTMIKDAPPATIAIPLHLSEFILGPQ